MDAQILDNKHVKVLKSKNYCFTYDKDSGIFLRHGATLEDDPEYSPFGPELLDLEISSGDCSGNCSFCYKENHTGKKSHHMTFDEFKNIFDKMRVPLTQIAFGICDVDSNPDFFKMMTYSRTMGVVPNYTCNGYKVTDEVAKQTAELCGAVSVSIVDEETSLKAVQRFIHAGMKQTNIHYMLSNETYEGAFKLIDKLKQIDGFHAIVFLHYKPKGLHPNKFSSLLSSDQHAELTNYCDKQDVVYGFDSCSCPLWLRTLIDTENADVVAACGEPCESGLFSSYINCHGEFYPCSFSEKEAGWETGIDVLNSESFIKDVWKHERVEQWRSNLIRSSQECDCTMKNYCRSCPLFNITPCKDDICKKLQDEGNMK